MRGLLPLGIFISRGFFPRVLTFGVFLCSRVVTFLSCYFQGFLPWGVHIFRCSYFKKFLYSGVLKTSGS